MSQEAIHQGPIKNFEWITNKNNVKLVRELKELVWNNDHPIIFFLQITELINSKLNALYKPSLVWKYLRTELNCSFKKVKPKPGNINMNRVKVMRQLYAVKFWQQVS